MRFLTRFRCAARLLLWMMLALLCLPQVSSRGQAPAESRITAKGMPSTAESVAAGTKLFTKLRCVKCHDAHGQGSAARDGMPEIPDFTSGRWQEKRTVAQLTAAILDGKGTKMPAFADRLSPEEARALAIYIRTLGPAHAAVEAAPPADDFQQRFDELRKEFQRLRKQFEELSGSAK
jgi:mono/diheme cytochrome c family protein